jgi:exodeoxyribonuclease VII small subunit
LSPSSRKASSSGEAGSFEDTFAELQRVVQQLEDGGLDLEELVALYDRGARLAEVCERLLDHAELRVTRLTPEPASPLSDVARDPAS